MYRPSDYAGFGFRSRFAQEKTKKTKTFTKNRGATSVHWTGNTCGKAVVTQTFRRSLEDVCSCKTRRKTDNGRARIANSVRLTSSLGNMYPATDDRKQTDT